ARLAVPRLADWCRVDIAEDGELKPVAVAHDASQNERTREIRRRWPLDTRSGDGADAVLESGRAGLCTDIGDERLAGASRRAEIGWCEVGARYRAAGEGEVGGDVYDVFEAGDGAWFAAIGDVQGKGPEAAAVTGLARYTIRAAARTERNPSRILRTLNGAMLK